MNNLRVETRYYTPGMLELGIWLTEEEYRRINNVIVCGPPDSPAPETLDSDLPDYEKIIADNPPTPLNGECIAVSTKNEVMDCDSLGAYDAPRNSPKPEPLEASDVYSDTSYAYEASSESSQDASESDTSYGYEASSEYSENDSESSSSVYIYTPDRNNIIERYVATPVSSRKRVRGRRLNFNDMNMVSGRLDIAVAESESDEPEAKRVAVTKWIGNMEQLYDLRRPTCNGLDVEE
uniref:Uncharacterized protein n=1 Tax=Bactrocera latifrons TaxID=174628 RepID=A0A0K8VGF3_BACLA